MVWVPPETHLEKPLPGPLIRLSVKYAKDIISRGGYRGGTEIISKDGYAMGWLTKDQIKTLENKK